MAKWAHIRRAGIAMIGAFTTGLGISGLVGCGLLGHNESRFDVDKIVREIEHKHEAQQHAKSATITAPVAATPIPEIPENPAAKDSAEAAARAALEEKIQAIKQHNEPPKTEQVASKDDVEQKYEAWKASQAKEILAKQVKDALESRTDFETNKHPEAAQAEAVVSVVPVAEPVTDSHTPEPAQSAPESSPADHSAAPNSTTPAGSTSGAEPLFTPEETAATAEPDKLAPNIPEASAPPVHTESPLELPITSSIGAPESATSAPIESQSISEPAKSTSTMGDLEQRAEFARKAAELAKKKAELAKEEAELAEKVAEFAELAAKSSATPTTMMAVPEPSPAASPDESQPATKADSEQLPVPTPSGASSEDCNKEQNLASTRTIVIPAEFRAVEKKVLVAAEHEEIQHVPAEFAWIDVKVEVEPARLVSRVVPAVYEDISEPVIDQPEQLVLVKDAAGRLVQERRAATYKLVTRRVVKSAEKTEKLLIPAKYEVIKKQIVKRAAELRRVVIPAKFQSVLVKELVKAEEVRHVALNSTELGVAASNAAQHELAINACTGPVTPIAQPQSAQAPNITRSAPPMRPLSANDNASAQQDQLDGVSSPASVFSRADQAAEAAAGSVVDTERHGRTMRKSASALPTSNSPHPQQAQSRLYPRITTPKSA